MRQLLVKGVLVTAFLLVGCNGPGAEKEFLGHEIAWVKVRAHRGEQVYIGGSRQEVSLVLSNVPLKTDGVMKLEAKDTGLGKDFEMLLGPNPSSGDIAEAQVARSAGTLLMPRLLHGWMPNPTSRITRHPGMLRSRGGHRCPASTCVDPPSAPRSGIRNLPDWCAAGLCRGRACGRPCGMACDPARRIRHPMCSGKHDGCAAVPVRRQSGDADIGSLVRLGTRGGCESSPARSPGVGFFWER